MADNKDSSKSPSLYVIGYVNIDENRFPDGTSVTRTGGAAYFAAHSAKKICPDVGLVTRIGGDMDLDRSIGEIRRDGVHFDPLTVSSRSIQTYHKSDDLSDRSIELLSGIAEQLRPQDIPLDWAIGPKAVHIGTMPPAHQREFLSYLKEFHNSTDGKQPTISIDTDQFLLKEPASRLQVIENLMEADLVFLNRRETQLLGLEFVQSLPFVVLKRDEEGAVLMRKGMEVASFTAPKIAVKDATGAGDWLAGAFCAALVEGVPEDQALLQAIELTAVYLDPMYVPTTASGIPYK